MACTEKRDMNTKTMRLPPRRVSMPTKRKEREDYKSPTTKSPKPTPAPPESCKVPEPDSPSNKLLAGYLAYEYLTKGTLFGKPFEAARDQAGPGSGWGSGSGQASAVEPTKVKPEKKDESEPQLEEENYKRYVEVASLLKTGGAHVRGIVNPTQLARFLHM